MFDTNLFAEMDRWGRSSQRHDNLRNKSDYAQGASGPGIRGKQPDKKVSNRHNTDLNFHMKQKIHRAIAPSALNKSNADERKHKSDTLLGREQR